MGIVRPALTPTPRRPTLRASVCAHTGSLTSPPPHAGHGMTRMPFRSVGLALARAVGGRVQRIHGSRRHPHGPDRPGVRRRGRIRALQHGRHARGGRHRHRHGRGRRRGHRPDRRHGGRRLRRAAPGHVRALAGRHRAGGRRAGLGHAAAVHRHLAGRRGHGRVPLRVLSRQRDGRAVPRRERQRHLRARQRLSRTRHRRPALRRDHGRGHPGGHHHHERGGRLFLRGRAPRHLYGALRRAAGGERGGRRATSR